MYLSLTLKKDNDSKSFIEEVVNTILKDSNSYTPKFKTWEAKILTSKLNKNERHHILKQKDTQLDKIGILYLWAHEQNKIKVQFGRASDCNPEDDQIVMYFSRCATMLRNHFGNRIESISILDL